MLGKVFGGVAVEQSVLRRRPSWLGLGALGLGTVVLVGVLVARGEAHA